ncbi:MAG: glycine C-acetyltransferase, partial [Candidatus Marinimicrobia bacterium]|nr:glycine C-acetyltransferase [Candidatus Neomarinimicrobiota bacterium]
MVNSFKKIISEIKDEGLYKVERPITSSQSINISTDQGLNVLNFCANNYLGLANHPSLISAAKQALDKYGFGMAS